MVEEVAAYRLRKGQYEEAAAVFQQLVGSGDLEADDRLAAMAHLVIALSWFDQESAEEHAMSLPATAGAEEIDPVELEDTEVPRSSRVRRLVIVDKAQQRADRKKSAADPEKRRRKRAAEREKYLKKLEEEGKYDPNKPVKPDAERWIAKKSRSYNKRGRKNKNKFSGAQGAGTVDSKDAEKLDAFARAKAKKEAEQRAEEAPAAAKSKQPYRKKRH